MCATKIIKNILPQGFDLSSSCFLASGITLHSWKLGCLRPKGIWQRIASGVHFNDIDSCHGPHLSMQLRSTANEWYDIFLFDQKQLHKFLQTPMRTMSSYWDMCMMTSSNGNSFRVTDTLCGEFTGHRWIPRTKASDVGALIFSWICAWIKDWVNNCEACDLRRHRGHYDVIVLVLHKLCIEHFPTRPCTMVCWIIEVPSSVLYICLCIHFNDIHAIMNWKLSPQLLFYQLYFIMSTLHMNLVEFCN